MPAIKRSLIMRPCSRKQKGATAVELALTLPVFLIFVFGIIELARAMYICNTLQEVTRQAAALAVHTDFSDASAMQRVREKAVFRDSPGLLAFADPVSDEYVKIDYLYIPPTGNVPQPITGALPSNPAANLQTCTRNPYDSSCIRLVRVRICVPDGDRNSCAPVPYKTLTSYIGLPFKLPMSTTIAQVETLGLPPGVPLPCGC
jgi:hypothetical protein